MAHPVFSSVLGPVLETALDAAVVMRIDGTVAAWNKGAEQIFGWPQHEAIGRSLSELVIPHAYREAHTRGLRRYLETGHGPLLNRRIEIEALHRDGHTFPVELTITPTYDLRERVFLGFMRDITERKQAENVLRENAQRLRATYEHAFVGIAEIDAAGRFLRANEAFCRITGYTESELKDRTFLHITYSDDIKRDWDLHRRQWQGELDTYTLEKRYLSKSGHLVWIELASSMVRDGSGQPVYSVRVARDITERKRAEAHQELLVNELNHRVKNTLSIVQGIARQTFRSDQGRSEQCQTFEDRLLALSATHDVLTQANWETTDLGAIINVALQPYRSIQRNPFTVEGPRLPLSPKIAVTLAMAFHELATNAAKYGALSCDTGRVSITWSIESDASAAQRLHLRWEEHDGPLVHPPTHRGFGSRLIEHGLASELGGKVTMSFQPEGLVCTIDAPLSGQTIHQPQSQQDAYSVRTSQESRASTR